jgi:TolB-like protein
MSSRKGVTTPSKDLKKSFLRVFLVKLRKRHVIETLAAFIAGGWLIIEFVDRILVAHYELNKKWLDVSFITLLGALLCILLWRWFSGVEKRPGNVKVEVLIVPLIILVALAIDLNLILQMAGILGKKLLIGIVTFLLGIAWVIFKLSQWAARTPDVAVRRFDISKLAEIKPEKSIVVLPFKNISPEEGQDYFSDGLTEELITKLSKVLSLRVISRTSAFMFKDTSKNVRDIAQELNVGYLLEGSVRKAGNKLRITAQLIT